MNRTYKVYMFALFGALGGLAGSFLHQHLLLDPLSAALGPGMRALYLALLGLLVGGCVGLFPSLVEGWGYYGLWGALRAGLTGAALGAIGGMIALPLAEWVHVHLGGGLPGRIVALAMLGLAVGTAEGINGGSRWWRGLCGGAIGGILAGLVLELLLPLQATHAASGILALLLIGLFIALLIALFVNVLADAWLEGLPGSKVDGQVYHLSKFLQPREAYFGSDKKGDVFIYVPDAEPRHATITLTPDGALLRHVASHGETRVDGLRINGRLLRDGEIFEIAHSRFRYRERRKAQLV